MAISNIALIAAPFTLIALFAPYIYRTMFSALKNFVVSEKIPAAVKAKSFYDLKATLPGKDRVLDFVSDHCTGVEEVAKRCDA
jgi:hypothetical protein